MKKYIRRANGVYELKIDEKLKKANVSNCFYTSDNDTNFNLLFEKKDLKQFKQADTIEDLCDEFVAVNDSMDLPILDSFENICLLLTTKNHKNDDVYGAIWTDKGLIYVAKMNKKGDLELL